MSPITLAFINQLRFNENGLIPAIAQDWLDGAVLMVAWMNAKAIRLTKETGEAHFWSRSREEIWRKGSTSGNVMKVVKLLVDCDQDTILVRVNPSGPACHTGEVSCFFQELRD